MRITWAGEGQGGGAIGRRCPALRYGAMNDFALLSDRAMSDLEITRIDASTFDAAAALMVEAFADDPLVHFVADGRERRLALTSLVFPTVLRLTQPDGHAYAISEPDERIEGAICISPPGRYPFPSKRYLQLLPSFISEATALAPSLRNIVPGFRYVGAAGRHHPSQPHWYLIAVAVAPSSRGRGVGGALLRKAIELAETDGLPLYLETTNRSNVGLYERFGWHTISYLHPHPLGPAAWGMLRPPGIAALA